MRVVAGELGGRRLQAPQGTHVRPTTDRVREAVFNSLGSMSVLDGALVADLFAGSGAVGIEALSRGAEHCVFVESDSRAIDALERNLEQLGLGDRSRVRRADAVSAAGSLDVDVVFADPPYDFERWTDLLGSVRASLIVAEAAHAIEPSAGWRTIRTKRYGRTWVSYLERDAQ